MSFLYAPPKKEKHQILSEFANEKYNFQDIVPIKKIKDYKYQQLGTEK